MQFNLSKTQVLWVRAILIGFILFGLIYSFFVVGSFRWGGVLLGGGGALLIDDAMTGRATWFGKGQVASVEEDSSSENRVLRTVALCMALMIYAFGIYVLLQSE